MDDSHYDELYTILDEMNGRIEEIFISCAEPELLDIVISKLNHKAEEFIVDFEKEVEKIELLELDA